MNSRRTIVFRFAHNPHRTYFRRAGWSSLVARQAHNLKVAGSNPAPATNLFHSRWPIAFTSFRTARENFTSVCLTMSCEGSLNTCTWQVNDRKRCDDASHSKALRAKSLPDRVSVSRSFGSADAPSRRFLLFRIAFAFGGYGDFFDVWPEKFWLARRAGLTPVLLRGGIRRRCRLANASVGTHSTSIWSK